MLKGTSIDIKKQGQRDVCGLRSISGAISPLSPSGSYRPERARVIDGQISQFVCCNVPSNAFMVQLRVRPQNIVNP